MDNELLDQDPFHDLIQADSTLSASFENLQRVMDSYTALESFMQAGESLPSFESVSRPMIAAILGGTDYDVDDLDVSVESVRGMVGSAVKAILAALQNFFKSLFSFLSSMDLAASWLMRKVVLLERQVASSRGKVAQQERVTLGRQYKYLRVGKVFAEDSLRLETELKNLLGVINVINTEYLNSVLKVAERLPAAVRGKTSDALVTELVGLIRGVPFDGLASKMGMSDVPYERFSRKNVQATSPLLGGKSLFYLKSDLDAKGVRGFRFHGFSYDTTGRDVGRVEATHDFNTLSPAQIGNIPTVVREILQQISKGANASTRSQITRTQRTLDNFVKAQESSAGGDVDAIRKTVSTLTYWMSSPSRALFIDSMSVCRAVVLYCNASIRTYR